MDTHTLAKALLEKPAVPICLFHGVDPESADNPEQGKFLTGPFDIYFSEEKALAIIMPVTGQQGEGGVTEADIKKLFTGKELQKAQAVKDRFDQNESLGKDSLTDLLEEHVVTEKKLKHIDKVTGVENIRRYWAYALQAYLDGGLRP